MIFRRFFHDPVPSPDVLSILWGEVLASRFSAILTSRRKLDRSGISVEDLLGPYFFTVIDTSRRLRIEHKFRTSGDVSFNSIPLFRNSSVSEAVIDPILELLLAKIFRRMSRTMGEALYLKWTRY